MNKSSKSFLFITTILFFSVVLKAQITLVRNVAASNGNDTLIGTTIWAYTTGESCVETFSAISNIFTQGFNQPDGYKINPYMPRVQDLIIYPNPASGNAILRFYLKEDRPVLIINIYDATGRLYQTQRLQSFAGQTWHSLNPQIMAAGIYLVKVTAEEEVFSGKLVIVN